MPGPVRVLVADDHIIARRGVCALLATEDSIKVVGEARDGREVVDQARKLNPDVVLLDLVMPGWDGIEAIKQISSEGLNVKILVLTSFAENDKVFPAIKSGAMGYLLKDTSPEELVQAIHQVSQGEASIHPSIAKKLLKEFTREEEIPQQESVPITPRETDVLKMVAKGMGNLEIAEALAITEATVRTHVSNILSKLHLASRTQAALYALREGLVSLENTRPKGGQD